MHNAPSVSYPVGRSLLAGGLAAAVWLLGALVAVQWILQSQVSGWRLGAAGIVLAFGATAAGWTWWITPHGTLAWDGQSWVWTGASGTDIGAVEVRLDLQRCLLLHFRGPPASRWLWLERSHCAERWDDLRRAVYSRARPQTPPEAEAGVAKP
jgi:toxin CptA